MPNTINGWIYFCPEFIYFIYGLALLILLLSVLVLRKTNTLREAIRKSIIISFCGTAVFYAASYEFIWSQWLRADISQFYGKSCDEKLVALNGDFYNFILQCKSYIGADNYTFYTDQRTDHYSIETDKTFDPDLIVKFKTFQYYLLPSRNVPNSRYLIVFSNGNANFDKRTGVLSVGDTVINNVILCNKYSPSIALFRVDR